MCIRDRVHGGLPQLFGVHLTKALIAVHLGTRHLLRKHSHFGVVVGILDGVALLHLEQGRLGHIHMALLDERAHIAEEEGEHQGADVGAIHIGIGHDEHFIIAQLGDIELVPNAAAQRQHLSLIHISPRRRIGLRCHGPSGTGFLSALSAGGWSG